MMNKKLKKRIAILYLTPIETSYEKTIKKDYLKYENQKRQCEKRLSEITKMPQNHSKGYRTSEPKIPWCFI